ncbi:MAG: DUF421 domain-containing protein [Trueperaceae bacterium]|nr:DUF421 domain-containing protein [Trueperaceae bacterium]
MEAIFFDGMEDWFRIIMSAPLIYLGIILFVNLSGKRSTSQMNNFDWVVTVAMGSLVSSGIILEDITISETLLGIGLLLLMQYLVTRLVLRSERVEKLVKAEPTLLFHKGEFLNDAMEKERVSKSEILSAIRHQNIADLSEVNWVILETDASFSIISAEAPAPGSANSALGDIIGKTKGVEPRAERA